MNWKVLVRSLSLLASVALLCGAALLIYFFVRIVHEPNQQGLPQASPDQANKRERIDLGSIEFEKFHALSAQEDWQAARLLCKRILREYPESFRAADAAQILTQMNLDQLLSRDAYDGKQIYTVKSGDSIGRIAQKFSCSQAYIISVSRLKRAPNIQPNDQLVVCPLHFRVEIDLTTQSLRLYELQRNADGSLASTSSDQAPSSPQLSNAQQASAERFFASFEIMKARFAQNQTPREKDEIQAILGLDEEGSIPVYDKRFAASEKLIRLRSGLNLRSVPKTGEFTQAGIYLKTHDLEDLSRILRPGHLVEFVKSP